MSGLHAVDVGIDPQQPVAVGLRDVVVAVLAQRIERVVLGKVADQRGARAARGPSPSSSAADARVPVALAEVRVREPEPRRFAVHPLGERVLAAGDDLGQRDRRVVAGLDDHSAQQLVDGDRLLRLDEHPRAFGAPRGRGHR